MSEVLFIVTFNSQTFLVPSKRTHDFDQLRESIYRKIFDLNKTISSMSCSFGRHSNVLIKDNGEFENMLFLVDHVGAKFVEVCLNLSATVENTSKSQPSVVSLSDHSAELQPDNSSISLTRTHNDQPSFGSFLPEFDVCPNVERPPLLSDNWKNAIKGVGQIFVNGRDEFRSELIKYSTKIGFRYEFQKNNKQYIYVVCKEKGGSSSCKWFIRGKQFPISGHFVITACNLNHNCSGNIFSDKTKRLGPKVLSSLVIQNVRSRPEHPGIELQKHIKLAYGLEVPYYKVWRSIDTSRSQLFGSYSKSFDQLRWYCEAVKRTNKGSHAWVDWDNETNYFSRAFFAFNACLEAFKYCRPMLFVDGTFMHGRTKSTILSAIGKDGNNGLLPVAFAIVNGETIANWKWFLEQLRELVKHKEKIFYVSDRNTGLLSAFDQVFGIEANNFYCLYHLHNNLRSHYSGTWSTAHRDKMCYLLTECAYAPNLRLYNENVENFLKAGGPLAKSFLDGIPPEKWAVSHQPHVMRYGEMTSNAAESFNNWILVARSLPVTYMVDTIRNDVMQLFEKRRSKAENWSSILCEKRQDIWNHHVELSTTWFVTRSFADTYQVSSNPSVKVDLKERTCSCMQWQIHGFPCPHAAAVILKYYKSVEEVIDAYFLSNTYKKCYSGVINPIPDTEKFECQAFCADVTILPPPKKTLPGRPHKKRKKSYGEVPRKAKNVCPSCGLLFRHDKLTCINNGGNLSQAQQM